MADTMDIVILDDGTIKITTGKISAPNHTNAEGFGRALAASVGEKAPKRTGLGREHAHEHQHEHGTQEHSR